MSIAKKQETSSHYNPEWENQFEFEPAEDFLTKKKKKLRDGDCRRCDGREKKDGIPTKAKAPGLVEINKNKKAKWGEGKGSTKKEKKTLKRGGKIVWSSARKRAPGGVGEQWVVGRIRWPMFKGSVPFRWRVLRRSRQGGTEKGSKLGQPCKQRIRILDGKGKRSTYRKWKGVPETESHERTRPQGVDRAIEQVSRRRLETKGMRWGNKNKP